MARSFNHVIVKGNLAADPVVRSGPKADVVSFRIALNDSVKRGDKYEDEVTWISVTVFGGFGNTAEFVKQYAHKGSEVTVHGRLKGNEWEKDGVKQYSIGIIADEVNISRTAGDTNTEETPARSAPAARKATPSTSRTRQVSRRQPEPDMDESDEVEPPF